MRSRKWMALTTAIVFLLATSIFVVAREYYDTSATQWVEEWLVSGHNYDPESHDFHEAQIRSSCVKCHNTEWFVKVMANGEDPPAEDLADFPDTGQVCTTCHNVENSTNILELRVVGDVTLPAYGDVVSGGVAASCMSCHNGRRVNPEEYIKGSFRGTHGGPQADMLSGTGAINYGETFGSSAHTIVAQKGCLTCHEAVTPAEGEWGSGHLGGHTFKMSWNGGTEHNPNDDIENIAACQQCHPSMDTFDPPARGDYDGDGVVEGVQTEVKGLLALLAAELPQDEDGNVSIPRDLEATTVEQRMANFNYTLVVNDGSYGIHNPAYAVQVLRTTYEQLTGNALPGDTIAAVPLQAALPVTSEAVDKRLEQWLNAGHSFDPTDPHVVEEFHGALQRSSCVKCHNGEWFARIVGNGEAPPPEDLAEPPALGHDCATCHAAGDNPMDILALRAVGEVTLPAYGDVVDAGISASCMTCHNARRANPEEYVLGSFRGSHGGPQADVFSGTGAIDYGQALETTSHFTAIDKKCVGCHMADTPKAGQPGHNLIGDHSFAMRDGDIEHVGACQDCHAGATTFDIPAGEDYDGNGLVEGIQTEIKGMLSLVAQALPPVGEPTVDIPRDLTLTTPEQRMANFNRTLILNDGSYGVHNPKYAVSVLRATYKALTGEDISTAKDYSNVFFTELDAGLNMVSLPLEPITPYTARRMLDELGATVIIKIDSGSQAFVGFTQGDEGDGFAVEGAEGYIVNVLEDRAVAFTGGAWTNEPALGAPAALWTNAWAFVANGVLVDEMALPVTQDGYTVVVRNRSSGTMAQTAVDEGRFDAVWADLGRQAVISVGDVLEFSVVDAMGERVAGPIPQKITTTDVTRAFTRVNLRLGHLIPEESALLANYPNPFNPETWIPFQLAEDADIIVRIFDASGGLVRTLDLGYRQAGIYTDTHSAVYWDGRSDTGERVASGIYFYQLQADDFARTRKMVVTK